MTPDTFPAPTAETDALLAAANKLAKAVRVFAPAWDALTLPVPVTKDLMLLVDLAQEARDAIDAFADARGRIDG